ncbi:MAG TPA: hypothetical protein VL354_21550, partial [Spirochaetia bacterium]|nr:hypothetical protein [Spirochaetia bacterium]
MKIADDFEISPTLYRIGLCIVFVVAVISTLIDFGNGQVVAGWLDILILAVDVASFLLAWRGWIGRNLGLGLVCYTCVINFMVLGLSLYFSHDATVTYQVMYSLVASMVFMGGAGIIVQRWGSLALGAVTTAYLCFLTFAINNKFLNDSFPAL